MEAMILSTNAFAISFGGLVPGRNYILESATDLSTDIWTTETNFLATQSASAWTNSTTASPQKFYRLVGY